VIGNHHKGLSVMGGGDYPPFVIHDKLERSMGRKKGIPNRRTGEMREAIAEVLDGNLDHLQAWIERVAMDDPHKAFTMVMDLARLVLPKVQPVAQEEGKDRVPVPMIVMPRD